MSENERFPHTFLVKNGGHQYIGFILGGSYELPPEARRRATDPAIDSFDSRPSSAIVRRV